MKNDEKIIFRLAKIDDAEKLVEIYAPYVKNTNITFEYEVPIIDEFKQRITKIMSKFPYILACIGDEIVGYTYASTFRERQAYNWCVETSIYINEKYQGRKIGEILYFWAKPLFINFKKGGFMKKVMFMFISLLTVLGVCSCNDNEVIEPVVSDSVSDMEVLSRFVDVNEITNEYYFNENKKTRALSYVTGSDWQDLEKVSPLSIEKYAGFKCSSGKCYFKS